MVNIFAQFLQRAESYAYDQGIPALDYRICSQPNTVCGMRFEPTDRIVVVGEISTHLFNMIQIVRGKGENPPPIERVWL